MGCRDQGSDPQYQQEGQYQYEKSKHGDEHALAQIWSTQHTLGRKDGCSNITELLRNFCTKQSFPWIAVTKSQKNSTSIVLLEYLLAYDTSATLSLLKQFLSKAVSTTKLGSPSRQIVPTAPRSSIDKLRYNQFEYNKRTSSIFRPTSIMSIG